MGNCNCYRLWSSDVGWILLGSIRAGLFGEFYSILSVLATRNLSNNKRLSSSLEEKVLCR
jgi:hypothetical protein